VTLSAQRLLTLLFLLSLGGVSFWLANLEQPPHSRPQLREPDYFLHDLKATALGRDGLPLRRLWAQELRHYPGDDSTEVTAPRLELYEADAPPWRLRADTAWLSGDGELLLLQGEVHIDRDGAAGVRPVQAVTHNLRVQPQERYAETDERVSLHSAASWVEATGMQAWLAGPLRLKLLSEARGRYEVN
jgi:lipopolysaccharide export system protein LptC